MNDKTCGLNYEKEYELAMNRLNELTAKYVDVCEEIRILRSKNDILKGQMEVVRLIFGGRE